MNKENPQYLELLNKLGINPAQSPELIKEQIQLLSSIVIKRNFADYSNEKMSSLCEKIKYMTLQDAKETAVFNGCTIRVMEKEGVAFCGTADAVPSRINVKIQGDLVVSATWG